MNGPTRRQILAALSGMTLVGIGAGSARIAAGLDTVELNQSAQIRTSESVPAVALDWRETVNGVVRDDTDLTAVSADNTGTVGVVVDEAVLPGDTGAVTLRATVLSGSTEGDSDGTDEADDSVELRLAFALTDTAENGITEPERAAGDDTPATGELQDVATVELWKDMGVGTGNGRYEAVPFVRSGDERIASGTLAAVDADPTFVDGDGYRLARGSEPCLSVGDSVYVSFRWSIPADAGNVIQGDSARFSVGFVPRRCPE